MQKSSLHQMTLCTNNRNEHQANVEVWHVYAPEEYVKHLASLNHNPNEIQSLNFSPNQRVYEEDPCPCQTNYFFQILFNTSGSLLEERWLVT